MSGTAVPLGAMQPLRNRDGTFNVGYNRHTFQVVGATGGAPMHPDKCICLLHTGDDDCEHFDLVRWAGHENLFTQWGKLPRGRPLCAPPPLRGVVWGAFNDQIAGCVGCF